MPDKKDGMPDKSERDGTVGDGAVRRLLRPESIAIAGASEKPGSLGAIVFENLQRFGFAGEIHLLHPTRPVQFGRRTVTGPADLPYGVDCVVLAIPVSAILEAVRACAANGVGGVVIFAAGFAELGHAGRALQEEVAAVADAAGMAIEGPNCLGFVNHVDGVPLTFAIAEARPNVCGPAVSVLSQSGAMASVLRASLHARGLEVAYAISTGNEAARGLEDFLAFLLEDPHTRVLCVVAEHIRQPQRFLALARAARARGIPIVMLHPGRSQAARASAQTHTGAMTGPHDVMLAHVRRASVTVADTLDALLDMVEILLRCPVPPRAGAAVLAESGAFKAMVLDLAEREGLVLPQPEGRAAEALDAIAPGFIVAGNPLDLTAQALGDPGLYARAADALTAHPGVGTLLVVIILTSGQMAQRKMPPVLRMMAGHVAQRCVVFAMLGEDAPVPDGIVAEVRALGVPFFRSPDRAIHALAALGRGGTDPGGAGRPAGVPLRAARLPAGVMAEYRAKPVLAAAGLTVPAGRFCTDCAQAEQAAAALGYPVALKVQSAALSHKSDVGGVLLDLADAGAVREGWDTLLLRVRGAAPAAGIDGVLVERMGPPGLELILGARRDPQWGPVVSVGLGGVLAEALGDVRVLAPDLDAGEVAGELGRLRGAVLFGAFRGRPARDVGAVAGAVVAVGRFMLAHPEVEELDINPLVALAGGEGVLALDALMVVG